MEEFVSVIPMKKLRKLATTIATILSVGMATHANAEIELRHGAKGDALLFPVYAGNLENYFTILNDVRDNTPVDAVPYDPSTGVVDLTTGETSHWIQGHLRFRGAIWSGELLDTDVILSPNDVFVFRLADVDGDHFWEIDVSLDPDNLKYLGLTLNCYFQNPDGTSTGVVSATNCIDQSIELIPPGIDPATSFNHQNMGYVEFIGEGVFNGMTHATMNNLANPANKGLLAASGQKTTGNKLGTHLWAWTNASGANTVARPASDVGNVLSGTAFITMPGASHGLAYNAEAFFDFRTTSPNPHRIDNYPPDQGVMLHDENVGGPRRNGLSPVGDYVYGFPFNPASIAGPTGFSQTMRFLSSAHPTRAAT